MTGINGLEAVILCLLALIVIGPAKLPEYAAGLARLVRSLRLLASGARRHLDEELGDEFKDIDWRGLDPRQYDPRTIVRDALADDITPPRTTTSSPTSGNARKGTSS